MCPALLTFPDLITEIIFSESTNHQAPQTAVYSSPLLPHTSWNQISSYHPILQTLSLCSSLSMTNQVSHPYKKWAKLYFCMFQSWYFCTYKINSIHYINHELLFVYNVHYKPYETCWNSDLLVWNNVVFSSLSLSHGSLFSLLAKTQILDNNYLRRKCSLFSWYVLWYCSGFNTCCICTNNVLSPNCTVTGSY
jgi:hypothetical protein